MTNLRVVKEPIHNYIAVSNLESIILNDRLFQRLHHITQNGTAYLTYPSNRTSRFIHSLGVMHLGGQMLIAGLFDSEPETRAGLIKSFLTIMDQAAKDVTFRIDQLQSYLRDENDICYRHYGLAPESTERVAEIVMFQSVRIACVLHDVGHPPFSHTTEHVLTSKLQSADVKSLKSASYTEFLSSLGNLRREELGQAQKLHENVGTALINYIFSEIPETGDRRRFAQFCFWIANRIANEGLAKDTPDAVFGCLHKIVSSNGFDSDRGDYVLRDGYASSFDFGEYDLVRVLDNLRFIHSSGRYQLVATTTATSALESFFLERYQIWRWLVFHHSVVRGEVALSRALTILLELFFDSEAADLQSSAIRTILENRGFSRIWKPFANLATYRDYATCDEPWLISLLNELRSPLGAAPLQRRLAMLRVYLDFVLARKKSSFVTLWKRAEEYEEFTSAVWEATRKATSALKRKELADLEGILKRENETTTEWFNRVIIPAVTTGPIGEIEAMRRIEDAIQKALKGVSGALLLKVLSFSTEIDCVLIDKMGKQISIQALSSVVQSLATIWNKDMQLRAYWVGLKRSGREYVSAEMTRAPTRQKLGTVFLSALLGGDDFSHLRQLVPQ